LISTKRMKTRVEIDFWTSAVIEVYHEGADWPGPGRRHLLQVLPFYASFQGAYGACVWTPTDEIAASIITYLRANPLVIQDICGGCRGWNRGPRRPRWNIYRGEEPPFIVPAFIEDWV